MRKKTMCLIGLLSEIAETPVFIGISAFRNKSHNGVTTEAERRQDLRGAESGFWPHFITACLYSQVVKAWDLRSLRRCAALRKGEAEG